MKIRNGFVTNSSSTNYIIISKDELNPTKLTKLLGVNEDSSIYEDVYNLSKELLENNSNYFCHAKGSTIEEQIENIFSKKTMKEYVKAAKNNNFIFYGNIDDIGDINASFALDCKKLKTNNTIIDFSDWGY